MRKSQDAMPGSLQQVVICPRCKGRRVVFDPMSLLLTIGLPIGLLMDAGDDEGITKRTCPTCDGEGWLGR